MEIKHRAKAEKLFRDRTLKHMELVRSKLANIMKNCEFREVESFVLEQRAFKHDVSKFSAEEKEGYVLFTWYKQKGQPVYPPHVKEKIDRAWKRHCRVNPHHPEHYQKIDHVLKVDLAEMVADIAAMSEELGDDLTQYVKDYTIPNYKWNEYQRHWIWNYVNALT